MTHQRSAIARGPHRVLTLHSSSGFPGLCEGSLPQRAWMAGAPNVASRSGGGTGPVGQYPPTVPAQRWPGSPTPAPAFMEFRVAPNDGPLDRPKLSGRI